MKGTTSMTLTEKAAYLRGIADGMKLAADQPSDKLLMTVIDMLDDIAKAVTKNEEKIEMLTDSVETMFTDLYDSEDGAELSEEDDDETNEEELYEIECPKCGERVYLDFDEIEQGDITCPACGELLEIEWHPDDGCECCDHEHDCP